MQELLEAVEEVLWERHWADSFIPENRRPKQPLLTAENNWRFEDREGAFAPAWNRPARSSDSGELEGAMTLTTTPDPPWLEAAFKGVFGDPTKELQDYLDRVNAEREVRKRDLEAAVKWEWEWETPKGVDWPRLFRGPGYPQETLWFDRPMDLRPEPFDQGLGPSWQLNGPDFPAYPREDYLTRIAGDIAYEFGFGPRLTEWLKKEGPKLGAQGIRQLAEQTADFINKTAAGRAAANTPGVPGSAQRDLGREKPLEFTVKGHKVAIPDFMIEGKIEFGAKPLEEEAEKLYRWLRGK